MPGEDRYCDRRAHRCNAVLRVDGLETPPREPNLVGNQGGFMKTLSRIVGQASAHWVGDGFPVRNLLDIGRDAVQASPFLMLDFAGPHTFAPGSARRGVGQHPHRGFETVTIVYQGEVEHRDTAGNHGTVGPGDVQWMTAAAGVLHQEFHSQTFTANGGVLEMVQLWVNLPARAKMSAPRYQTLLDAQIPQRDLPDGAGSVRVIAGDYGDARGPAQTTTPMSVVDVRVKAGTRTTLHAPDGWTAALAVLHGRVRIDGQVVDAARLAHFSRSDADVVVEAEQDSVLLWLAGEPLNEPIAHYGPFVMNTRAELQQAIEDFNSGKFGVMAA